MAADRLGDDRRAYAVALAEEDALAVAVGDGVGLRSDDAGITWSMGQVPEDTTVLRGVAGRDGEWLAVGEDSQTLGSVDGGRTWQRIESKWSPRDLLSVAVDRYNFAHAPEAEPFLVSDGGVFVVSGMRWEGRVAITSEEILGMPRDGAWWVGDRGMVLYRPSTTFGSFTPLSADPEIALHAVDGTRTRVLAVGAEGLIVRAELHELGCS
ncbi:hypothetical protein SAMN02745121_01194 [Nannocystis exedens]|uniref:Photosynthesis system II assembly factor Ycf48/Hcf136-like domain-containing protein n=1 Tax=Nannocystis exedens TaxID=54 RepID=A0A1I1UMQ5_9BACT|nr:hypothetical protein [Nannocystis exedens]PCC71651.1 hypothetical protein NAEX_04728 [Nannocystis exedens]SFD69260.1 hypothetical protein SAMN02745121_01194 [Nannocystis exedens]